MSLHFIVGKKGGGKSYRAVEEYLADELYRGRRWIVTNLPLDLGEIQKDLDENYRGVCDVNERIRLVNQEQMRRWWLIRPGCWVKQVPEQEAVKTDVWLEWETEEYKGRQCVKGDGVLYIFDEIQLSYRSEDWAEVGAECKYYLCQERKTGDTIVAVTQFPDLVAKPLRVLAQDWEFVANMGKEQFFGVRGPLRRCISRRFADQKGTASMKSDRLFTIDVNRYGKWYRTEDGAGIKGKRADTEERQAGIPWWSAAVILVLLAGLALLALKGCRKGVEMGLKGVVPHVDAKFKLTNSIAATVGRGAVTNRLSGSEGAVPVRSAAPGPAGEASPLRLSGITVFDGRRVAFFSDGGSVTEGEPGVEFDGLRGVVVGQRYYRFELRGPSGGTSTGGLALPMSGGMVSGGPVMVPGPVSRTYRIQPPGGGAYSTIRAREGRATVSTSERTVEELRQLIDEASMRSGM